MPAAPHAPPPPARPTPGRPSPLAAWLALSVPTTAICLLLTLDTDGDEIWWPFLLPLAASVVPVLLWWRDQPPSSAAEATGPAKAPNRSSVTPSPKKEATTEGSGGRTALLALGAFVGHGVAVGMLVGLLSGDVDQAGTAFFIALLLPVLLVPIAALVVLILGAFVMGMVGVVGLVCERRYAVAAWASFIPLLFGGLALVAVGAAAYDSPRRRDVRPLLGFSPDDVTVRSHALLQVGRVGAAMVVVGVLIPFVTAGVMLLLPSGDRRRSSTSDDDPGDPDVRHVTSR